MAYELNPQNISKVTTYRLKNVVIMLKFEISNLDCKRRAFVHHGTDSVHSSKVDGINLSSTFQQHGTSLYSAQFCCQ